MHECDKKTRFTCSWIFNILVVLCDGKVVCGCADPYGERPLGNVRYNTLLEIFNSDLVKQIRSELNEGHSCFCDNCGMKRILREDEEIPQGKEHVDILPRIFIEPTVLCNLNCYKSVCNHDSGIIHTRSRMYFPLEEFKPVIDGGAKTLNRIDFFNYGDPFVHKDAAEMIAYVKEHYKGIYVYTSTNGLMLDDEKIKKIVASGLDEITFSVDGGDQESYSKYRQGGDFNKVLEIMRKMVIERNKQGREVPFINWRYILFNWNDGDKQMKRAKKLAEKIGVDRFTWEITDHPVDAKSEKYQWGTQHWKKIFYEIWDTNQLGNGIKKKRYLAKLKTKEKSITVKAGEEGVGLDVKIKNTGGGLWWKSTWSGRRYVRLGVQLYDENKNLLDNDFCSVGLNKNLAYKEKDVLRVTIPKIETPGRYLLKLDPVMEFKDWNAWFESGGSSPLWLQINVL